MNLQSNMDAGIEKLPENGSHQTVLDKLWIYTNYDCNLSCSYCVARSTPRTPRRALDLRTVIEIIDEACSLGIQEIFFTGGEPLILNEIYAMLDYSSQKIKTSLLTNAMLINRKRLEELIKINHPNLTVQVSLDGGQAEQHDAYRGAGTWKPTLEGIQNLQRNGFHVRLSTTETPANTHHLEAICALHGLWGIPEEDHFIRPLAKRGFSQEGMELNLSNINPEVTVNVDGVFWHPLSTDTDMQVSQKIFPLAEAIDCIKQQLEVAAQGGTPRISFT